MSDEFVVALTAADWLPYLETLNLSGDPEMDEVGIGAAGAAALAAAAWPRLQKLELSSNNLCGEAAAALAAAAWPRLQQLNISGNPVGPMGAASLTEGKWPSLTKLNLDSNDVGGVGAASLVLLGCANWTSLQTLHLEYNGLEECMGAVLDLAAAKWPGLQVLLEV